VAKISAEFKAKSSRGKSMKCPWSGPFRINKQSEPHIVEIGDDDSSFVCDFGKFPEEGGAEWVEQALNEKWAREHND
jgi:hypothetical protein